MSQTNVLRLDSGEAVDGVLALRTAGQAGTVRGWNELALQAIRATRPDPSASTRALAALHTCMYNAWAAYDAAARQTVHGRAVRLPREERSAASKASAMSHAAHILLCDRFPASAPCFDARMAGLGLAPSMSGGLFTPAGIGHAQASAMLDFYRRGGGDPPGAPAAGLPFARVAPGEVQPAMPAAALGIEDRDLPIAWCRLAQQVSERDGYDGDRDVLLYFALANALADAVIAGADAGAAAGVVLRSFTGSDEFAADKRAGAGRELGREVGARVFEKARRYWQGKF